MRLFSPSALATSVALFLFSLRAGSAPITVLPEQAPEFTTSLQGEWAFQYLRGQQPGVAADFFQPSFDVSAWKLIAVPSHWELQGFAEPSYALKLEDGLGLYRRSFRVPAGWRGTRRVCLRFEGVAYGFEVWVNGTKVGASTASAYNPHTFDLTEALRPDAEADNVLAVQVTTKPLGFEFDVNDDWALSGIYREVSLFSVPALHVEDLATRTHVAEEGTAELTISTRLNQAGGAVHGRLLAPDGRLVEEFTLEQEGAAQFTRTLRVAQPQLWTAETPAIYRLQLVLREGGEVRQSLEQPLGLREVSIQDGVLRLNGRPIKLHGVDHHDLDPEHGRAITAEWMQRDLDLMKKGNINFIRTSHYPPQPEFLRKCDEQGFYVMCEVPIGKGEEHLNDPRYREAILARVEPTVTRDKNHPSVIVWSVGNENPDTEVEVEACRRAKELDPTRPVCLPKIGSYFEKNYGRTPAVVDIYAPHYPSNSTLRRYTEQLTRPFILTEYAHALGLAMDRVQEQWEMLQASPHAAGGAVWMFQDQGILRRSEKPVDRTRPTEVVWLDAHRYYDGAGNQGADGIVYSDRTPQADYWEVRRVYSPVQIRERTARVAPGAQEIRLTVENRHDFRALSGMTVQWALRRFGTEVQKGSQALHAPAHERETVRLPVQIPEGSRDEVLTLAWQCLDEKGKALTEGVVRLEQAGARPEGWIENLPAGALPKVTESAEEVRLEHATWVLTVTRASGALTLRDRAGRVLVAGISPHTGRQPTMTERLQARKANLWPGPLLPRAEHLEILTEQAGENLRLRVAATYPRPQPEASSAPAKRPTDDPLLQDGEKTDRAPATPGNEALVGSYTVEISPRGTLHCSYDYVPTHATGSFSEAGLSLVLPGEASEFRWLGEGPYPGYPGKDRLNDFGRFQLNRDDLRFQGNRRGTELAALSTPAGAGIALVATPADVAVERAGEQTLLSHNAVLSGLGNKGVSPEQNVSAEKTPHLTGSFTLLVLSETWPQALVDRLGEPKAKVESFQPFYHSYDQ